MPAKSHRAQPSARKKPKAPARTQNRKPAGKRKGKAKPPTRRRVDAPSRSREGFPKAFASLLQSRGLKVPQGLLAAPPEAYAAQPAKFVETLARLDDMELAAHAERVATYAKRQADRARDSWESSPLIAEIRRRRLKEPERPKRVVALAFSLKRPLAEWSNAELLLAAREWSKRGR
jgi:hypothetical protein